MTDHPPEGDPLARIPVVTLVRILPTSVWIESDIFGSRHVMRQHEGGEPFCYVSFHYDYTHTDNATTRAQAERMARDLGAVDPIEHRGRKFEMPAATSPAPADAPEREADARDAKRYRWLRTPVPSGRADRPAHIARSINIDHLRALAVFQAWCSPDELDAAIDSAMAQQEQPK